MRMSWTGVAWLTVMGFCEEALALAGRSGPSQRFRLADDALLVAIEAPAQACALYSV